MIPNCIIWELRNKGRYDNHIANAESAIHKIDSAIGAILSVHSVVKKRNLKDEYLLRGLKVGITDVQCKSLLITRWFKPVLGRVKLNSDGCSKGNPGRSGWRNRTLLSHQFHHQSQATKSRHGNVNLFIDGLWSAYGGERIIVFTTNYVEKLIRH